jgi:hypothetical protein
MVICSPAFVSAYCFHDSIAAVTPAHCRMVLKSMLTDNMHQSRKCGHIDYCPRAKRIEWIVGKLALGYIRSNRTRNIVRTDARNR